MTANALVGLQRRLRPGLLPLLGALAGLGHAPFDLPVLTVLGFAFFLREQSLRCQTAREAARAGFAFGAGYFLVTLHWIVQPFFVDAQRHGWMAPFALAGLAGIIALYWSAGIWVAARLAGRPGAAAAVFGLALAELLRSAVPLGGFPWALIGSVWVDTPVRGLAAYTGVHGLTLLTLALAFALSLWSRRGFLVSGVLAIAAALTIALTPEPPEPGPDAIRVRVIQANAEQHLKWRADMIPVFWQRRLELTAVQADRQPDAVVWPEVALPYLAGTDPEADARIAAAAGGATVLAGAQRRSRARLHNSLIAIAADGSTTQTYDKHHLVPFGEYFPGGSVATWLGLTGLANTSLGAFTPGPGPRVMDLNAAGLGRVAPLICYEAIFPRYGHVSPRPDWFVQVTNDAWFGSFAGPQQHLDLARLRATEQGIPVVRSANTGISAVIGPNGALLGQIPLNTAGYLDVDLPAALPPTLYSRTGNLPTWLALAALALWLIARRRVSFGA